MSLKPSGAPEMARRSNLSEDVKERKPLESKSKPLPGPKATRDVYLQACLVYHQEKTAIIERPLTLPTWYQPESFSYICHPETSGMMKLGPVIYDGKNDRLVLCAAQTIYDLTVTLEEWLEERVEWQVSESPLLIVETKAEPEVPDGFEDNEEFEE